MSEKQNAALEFEGLDEPGIDEPEEVKRIQMSRYGICHAVTEVLESIYGENLENDPPEIISDEQSPLVTRLVFGPDVATEILIPYEGKVQISDHEIEFVFNQFRDRLKKALAKYVDDPASVIRQRF